MYICLCKGITDKEIAEAVNNGAESMREIRQQLGVASGCGTCADAAREVIAQTLESSESSESLFYKIA